MFELVREAVYKLILILSHSILHLVYLMFLLKKYLSDDSYKFSYEELKLGPNLCMRRRQF